jgi:CRISPR-associated protein (TIGR03986 family)
MAKKHKKVKKVGNGEQQRRMNMEEFRRQYQGERQDNIAVSEGGKTVAQNPGKGSSQGNAKTGAVAVVARTQGNPRHAQNIPPGERKATAPYNFVPLNSNVVETDRDADKFEDRDTFEGNSGYIDCMLRTLTPLYIRDTLTKKEMEEKEKMEEDQSHKYINSSFFSPANNRARIPGSSLRGMIRTLVEIVSWSKFGFTDFNRKFCFRSFADMSEDLRKKYSDIMICRIKGGYAPKVKSGVLFLKGGKYYISPSKDVFGVQYFRVEENDVIAAKLCDEEMRVEVVDGVRKKYKPNLNYKMGCVPVFFRADSPKVNSNHSTLMYYGKVTAIEERKDSNTSKEEWNKGYLIMSGWIPARHPKLGKHLHWVINEPLSGKDILIANNVVDNYMKDEEMKGINLLKLLEESGYKEVPCFYILDSDGKIASFGHTGMFRLSYEKSLQDIASPDLANPHVLDISESIFGRALEKKDKDGRKIKHNELSGRVFFEDAVLSPQNQVDYLEDNGEPIIPKILSSPKPTTFQHYLTQYNDISYTCIDNNANKRIFTISEEIPQDFTIRLISKLRNYNSIDADFRGNKLYWHRKTGNNWKDTINKIDSQHTKICPIRPGVNFQFRIRFENLTNVELGALLFALDLPQGANPIEGDPLNAHKLGMGKPLGLGSVLIKPELFITDRQKRYESLFDKDGQWEKGLDEKKDMKKYEEDFAKYVTDNLRKIGSADFDEVNYDENNCVDKFLKTYRIKQLFKMLLFSDAPNSDLTKYMQLPRFKDRPVLPIPEEVN